jgi:hypothetical protein
MGLFRQAQMTGAMPLPEAVVMHPETFSGREAAEGGARARVSLAASYFWNFFR